MLSINTNLSSLIAQNNLKTSTNKLNQAIERLTTGFRVNRAKDDAAAYSIIKQMDTKISSLMVAEDNTAMGLDMVNTVTQTLEQIEDRLTRLRNLQMIISNDTYDTQSVNAVNKECNAIVDEINRLYQTTEYNGINLLEEATPNASGEMVVEREVSADEGTTFEQLNISSSSFNVLAKDGTLISTYDVDGTNTLDDFLTTLRTEGFSAEINNGKISLSSNDGRYITGALADELGISTLPQNYVASTEQTFTNIIPVTTQSTTVIVETTTTTNSTTNTTYEYTTQMVDSTTTRTIETTTVTTTETVIVDFTIVTTSTTQTNTIYVTTTIDSTTTIVVPTTTVTVSETVIVDYTTTTVVTTNTYDTILTETIEAENTVFVINTTYVATTRELKEERDFLVDPCIYTDAHVSAMTRVQDVSTFTNGKTYAIYTTEELQKLATLVNSGTDTTGAIFVLGADLDLSGVSSWTPIGNDSNSFKGTFDGNGHVISNLTINSSFSYQGLFGYTASGSEIKNVGLEGGSVESSSEYIGMLVGLTEGNISNCYAINTDTMGCDWIGGLIGGVLYGTITNCYTTGYVSGDNYVGGLIGAAGYGSITNCYATGTVTTNNYYAGGLVGLLNEQLVTNCYATGTVTTNNYYAGGLVGQAYLYCTITNCYTTGNINGVSSVGGLVGDAEVRIKITNCYTTGSVTVNNGNVGGLVGEYSNDNNISNCFSVQSDDNATQKTEAEILTASNLSSMGFTGANGWSVVGGSNPTFAPYSVQAWANVNSTLGDFGISSAKIYLTDGTTLSYNFTSTNTLADVLDQINNSGLSLNATITNGQITVTGVNIGIDVISGSDNLFKILNTTTATNITSVTATKTEVLVPYSMQAWANVNSTLGDFGVSSAKIYLTDGTTLSYNFTSSNTLADVVSQINNSGKGMYATLDDGAIVVTESSVRIDTTTSADNLF